MLEIQNLSVGYPGNPVLSGLSAAIPEGCVTAVIGPNGCGKSTLLKALAGILPSEGSLRLNGESLTELSSRNRAQKIAYLPQNRPIPEITVRRLILHGRFPYLSYPRHYRKEDLEAADRAMAQMNIAHLADRFLPALSGGERQKVYIAMLLAQGTPLILMDEPTSYLDISHKFDVICLARDLQRQGKTVVMVLHDLDLALQYSDHILLMEHGCIKFSGSPEEAYRSGLLEAVFHVRTDRISTEDGARYFFRPVYTSFC